jgi:hypothetical protein
MARYPALPLTLSALRPDAVVLVDDATREAHVMREWLQRMCCFVWDVNSRSEKGIGMLFRHQMSDAENIRVPGWLY